MERAVDRSCRSSDDRNLYDLPIAIRTLLKLIRDPSVKVAPVDGFGSPSFVSGVTDSTTGTAGGVLHQIIPSPTSANTDDCDSRPSPGPSRGPAQSQSWHIRAARFRQCLQRKGQIRSRLKTLLGILLQATLITRARAGGVSAQLRDRRGLFVQDGGHGLAEVGLSKLAVRKHLVQDCAKSEDVAPSIDGPSAYLLRGHVADRAHHHPGLRPIGHSGLVRTRLAPRQLR